MAKNGRDSGSKGSRFAWGAGGSWIGIVWVLLSCAGVAAAPAPVVASQAWVMSDSGSTEFRAEGRPSALKILGKGPAPAGELKVLEGGEAQGTFALALDHLDTGIDLRNRHMKDKYLETGKYPEARLEITRLRLPPEFKNQDFKAENLAFEGRLWLHGQDKPVSGTVRVERAGQGLSLEAGFGLKVSDFAIAVPVFAGITMADQVQVKVQATAKAGGG